MRTKLATAVYCLASAFWFSSPAAGQTLPVEIKVADETVPPGGTVQLKFSLTEPRPIMTGTKSFAYDDWAFDGFFGVAVSSPLGDAFGVASYGNGGFGVRYLSPSADYGTVVDYPILTIAAHIRPTAPLGAKSLVTLGAGSFTDPLGQTRSFIQNRPATITVGNKLAIHNVVPGGGTWDAGTVIRVLGTGFTRSTLVTAKFRYSPRFVSENEIDLVLQRPATMDTQPIVLSDKLGKLNVSTTYYSYLRGVEAAPSANQVIANAIPVFPQVAYPQISIDQSGAGFNGSTLTALALQNNNPAPVTLTLTASTPLGRIGRVSVTLAYGEKITRELGEYFGAPLPIGARVQVEGTGPFQCVPFLADASSGALTPFVAFR